MTSSDDPTPSQLPFGLSRETAIRRDRLGRWFDGETAFEHAGLQRAFDRWVRRHDDGRYVVDNGLHWAYVTIEGAPVFVRGVRLDEGGAWLTLSLGDEERLDVDTLRLDRDGWPFCDVRGGALVAAFERDAALALFDAVDEDADGAFLRLGGRAVRPPVVDEPLVRTAHRPLPSVSEP